MDQESQKRKLEETSIETQNSPILCANNCGFFGSASTNNLCSKCYKDYLLKQSKNPSPGSGSGSSPSPSSGSGSRPSPSPRPSPSQIEDEKNKNKMKIVQIEANPVEVAVGNGDPDTQVVIVDEGASSENLEKRPANRCCFCRNRVGLTGFKCRCGQTFCSLHRYSDKHNYMFDYKGAGQDAIAKENPVVKADKIEKI